MKKPSPKPQYAYDYIECRNYLEWKYGLVERDFKNNRDFWHWVVGTYSVRNGGVIHFTADCDMPMTDWQKQIYDKYISEFADDRGVVALRTEW